MNLVPVLYSILLNLIVFFTLEIYTGYFAKEYLPERKISFRKAFLIFNITYSFLPTLPYAFGFTVSCLSDFIYIYYTTKSTLKQKLRLCFKYWFFSYAASFVFYVLHSFLTMDWIYSHENRLYNSYKEVLCYFLIYVFLSVYINHKTWHYEQKEVKTIRSFHLLLILISLFISVVPLTLKLETESSQNVLILTFSILMILVLFFLSLYKKMLLTLDENMKSKIELEINQLKEEYSEKLETNIAQLRSLRHDMKNHFIVIAGYAKQQNTEKILSYLERMGVEYGKNTTIVTPSPVISSLLNSKAGLCLEKQILFSFSQNFGDIYLEDFDILTILGNILDNAIRASEKCANASVSLQMTQQNSYLQIECQNNYIEDLKKIDDTFLSTKEDDGQQHGLGLANVRLAVEKYNGMMEIQTEASLFKVHITIPNYK